jgi:putative Mg2+ transporter-C (MgtC) family protein
MDLIEIVVRACAAMLAGAVLGLNRDLHGKPTGIRTLGLVGGRFGSGSYGRL